MTLYDKAQRLNDLDKETGRRDRAEWRRRNGLDPATGLPLTPAPANDDGWQNWEAAE